eukprot:5007794-Alexandrium_andersonii.AAC.1
MEHSHLGIRKHSNTHRQRTLMQRAIAYTASAHRHRHANTSAEQRALGVGEACIQAHTHGRL